MNALDCDWNRSIHLQIVSSARRLTNKKETEFVLAEIVEWGRGRRGITHKQHVIVPLTSKRMQSWFTKHGTSFLIRFLFAVRALPDFISALFTTTAANGNNLIALLMCLDSKNNFFDYKFSGFPPQNFFSVILLLASTSCRFTIIRMKTKKTVCWQGTRIRETKRKSTNCFLPKNLISKAANVLNRHHS